MEVRLEQTGSCCWWRPSRFELTGPTGRTALFRYSSWMHVWSSWGFTLYPQVATGYRVRLHPAAPIVAQEAGMPRAGVPAPRLMVQLRGGWDGSETSDEVPLASGGSETVLLVPGGSALEAVIPRCGLSYVGELALRLVASDGDGDGGSSLAVALRMAEVSCRESCPDVFSGSD
jgi:hypothetical protein